MPSPSGLVVKNGSKARGHDLRRHAGAGVSHAKCYELPGRQFALRRRAPVQPFIRRLNRNTAAIRHGVPRIDAQVQQRVLQLVRIHQRRPQTARADKFHRNRRAHRPAHQIFHVSNEPVHICRLWIQCLPPRKSQQSMRQRRRAIGSAPCRGYVFCRLLMPALSKAGRQHIQAPRYACQQIVEVVRQPAGQLANRLHLLRLPQGVLGRRPFGDLQPQLGRSRGHHVFKPFRRRPALGNIGAYVILASPAAHRRGYRADHRCRVQRSRQHGGVAQRHQYAMAPGNDFRPLLPARHHHERHVRPRFLLFDPLRERRRMCAENTFLGNECGVRTFIEGSDQPAHIAANKSLESSPTHDLRGRRGVPPYRGEYEHPPTERFNSRCCLPRQAAVSGRRNRPGCRRRCP